MTVQGRDCLIVIKTRYREIGVPYAEETIREAVSLLTEEAAIEGDGLCRAIRKSAGVTGCVVTPLTIGTAPILLYLAMGSSGLPLYVSETRNIYLYKLNLLPAEDSTRIAMIQERGGERKLSEGCAVTGFELRIHRGEAVKLKLDIQGERSPFGLPNGGAEKQSFSAPNFSPNEKNESTEGRERFMGDRVTYRINGTEYHNIYGLTFSTKKEGGTRTELWIKRSLDHEMPSVAFHDLGVFAEQKLQLKQTNTAIPGGDLPGIIEELTITAQLLRDKYEYRYYGIFRLTLFRLVLTADETAIDCADGVIGPLRYYVAGTVGAEVFTNSGGNLE
jgi:hypothetical protein